MEPLFASLAASAISVLPQPYPLSNFHPVHGATLSAEHLAAVTLLMYPGFRGTCTASPHQLTFSDERAVVTVWFLTPGHAIEPQRCGVTFHLKMGGVDRFPLRERIYDTQQVKCNSRNYFTAHFSTATDDESDLKPSFKLLELQEKLENTTNWLQNLPHPDGCSTEKSHSIELRSQDDLSEETPLVPQLKQSAEFYRFEDLPLEIRRYVIRDFSTEAFSCFCPSQPDALWRHLSKIVDGSLHQNVPLEMVAARTGYLRRCMVLGTSWYQIIGRFLLTFPLVSSTDGTRFLRKLKENLDTYQFSHFRKSNKHIVSARHNRLGYLHIPEFFEHKDGPVDCTIDSQFSTPCLNDAEQLIIAPEEWKVCADGDHPGGPTAFSGWGNAWMIQDAFRTFTNVKRLALSLGSIGDNSWAFSNSSFNLSNLTHLHLDVPLPRHFHPGSPSLERFKSCSPASEILPAFPIPRLPVSPSHHLCPMIAPLAPRLEVLSLHGAGAHICNQLLDAPWINLRELYASLDAESGGVCHGALASSRNAARQLARRLPSLDMRLSLFLMDDIAYKEEPYLWGGKKPQHLETPHIVLPDNPSVCCLTCMWGIPCRTKEPGHRTQEGWNHFKRLFEVYKHRLRESTIGWLGELGWTRCFHQYDPLCDLRDHCGDVDGDWLRVQSNNALPKPDRWLDTSVAPLGDRCGIKRGRNLEGYIRPTANNFSFDEEYDPSGEVSLRGKKAKHVVATAWVRAWLELYSD